MKDDRLTNTEEKNTELFSVYLFIHIFILNKDDHEDDFKIEHPINANEIMHARSTNSRKQSRKNYL